MPPDSSGAPGAAAAKTVLRLSVLSAQSREALFPPSSVGSSRQTLQTTNISFYPSSSDASIHLAISSAISSLLEAHSGTQAVRRHAGGTGAELQPPRFILEDASDGSFVTLNSSLPNNSNFNCLLLPPSSAAPRPSAAAAAAATATASTSEASRQPPPQESTAAKSGAPRCSNFVSSLFSSSTRASSMDKAAGPPLAPDESNFRSSLLKFERINAHLANERTWLAWIRTAVSVLGCSFSFLGIANSSAPVAAWACVGLGCGFVVATCATFYTGWSRYKQVKFLLSQRLEDLNENFDRLGVGYQSRLLGMLFFLTSILYFLGGTQQWLWKRADDTD